MMTAGRKKKSRMIGIDYSCIRCRCFGPVQFTKPELKRCEHTMLAPDELQSLVYQDIEHLTMDVASRRMGVSKTVYAGIYASARTKVTQALLHNHVLTLDCPVETITDSAAAAIQSPQSASTESA